MFTTSFRQLGIEVAKKLRRPGHRLSSTSSNVIRVAALTLSLTLLVNDSRATTVVPMNLTSLADHSGQVIVGTITTVRSYWSQNPKRIESELTLSQVTYLKGTTVAAASTFRLIVPGGRVGQAQMRLAGAPTFGVGEQWLLCLLPTYQTFPVVGITQGALRIERDWNGIPRVLTASSQPVLRVDAQGFLQVGQGQSQLLKDPSQPNGTTSRAEPFGGIRLLDPPHRSQRAMVTEQAMTYARFLEIFQPILTASRDYHLSRAAGKRILVHYTPVPLKHLPTATSATNTSSSPPTPGLRVFWPIQRVELKKRSAKGRAGGRQ